VMHWWTCIPYEPITDLFSLTAFINQSPVFTPQQFAKRGFLCLRFSKLLADLYCFGKSSNWLHLRAICYQVTSLHYNLCNVVFTRLTCDVGRGARRMTDQSLAVACTLGHLSRFIILISCCNVTKHLITSISTLCQHKWAISVARAPLWNMT